MNGHTRASRRHVAFSAAGVASASLALIASAFVVLPDETTAPQGVTVTTPAPMPTRASLAAPNWTPIVVGAPAATIATITSSGFVLGVDTRGSDARVVHASAVVTNPLPVGPGLVVRASLDWGTVANACYRAAGLRVEAQDAATLEGAPAAWLEIVGVPPGDRARRFAALRTGPHPTPIFTDGWPGSRSGRVVNRTTLELTIAPDRVSFAADGEALGEAPLALGAHVRLVLYTTSHANYPARPVTFEDVTVSERPAAREPLELARPDLARRGPP